MLHQGWKSKRSENSIKARSKAKLKSFYSSHVRFLLFILAMWCDGRGETEKNVIKLTGLLNWNIWLNIWRSHVRPLTFPCSLSLFSSNLSFLLLLFSRLERVNRMMIIVCFILLQSISIFFTYFYYIYTLFFLLSNYEYFSYPW